MEMAYLACLALRCFAVALVYSTINMSLSFLASEYGLPLPFVFVST